MKLLSKLNLAIVWARMKAYINNRLEGLEVPVDYVVEQGASGIWIYRKWASGLAECWGVTADYSTAMTTAWGSNYVKDDAIPQLDYPFTFTRVISVNFSEHKSGSSNFWFYTGNQPGTTSKTPSLGAIRSTQGTGYIAARFYVLGRWK